MKCRLHRLQLFLPVAKRRSGLFCDYALASSSQHAVSPSGVDGENISQSSKSRHPHQSSGDAGRWKEHGGPGCPGCRRMPLSPDGSDSAPVRRVKGTGAGSRGAWGVKQVRGACLGANPGVQAQPKQETGNLPVLSI